MYSFCQIFRIPYLVFLRTTDVSLNQVRNLLAGQERKKENEENKKKKERKKERKRSLSRFYFVFPRLCDFFFVYQQTTVELCL